MNQRWKVKLSDDLQERTWDFNSKEEAESFIEDRYNLTNHLGYNPDDVYYLYPIE